MIAIAVPQRRKEDIDPEAKLRLHVKSLLISYKKGYVSIEEATQYLIDSSKHFLGR